MWYNNILELIGNTPLVKINKLNPNPKNVTILAKLEYFNPGGSVKDRIGVTMIEGAEKKGLLGKNRMIIEATSGNTGIGLAMAAAVKDYSCVFTMPDWMSKSKEMILNSFGAKVVRCPTAVPIDDPRGYKTTARRLSQENKAFLPDQYSNPDNIRAHYEGTGPEIWKETDGKIDYIIIGIGTGGTAAGTVRFLKEKNPKIKFIAPDPVGSVYSGKLGPFFIEGIGHIFFPKNVDLKMVDEFVRMQSKKAIEMAREITRKEGILAGPSSGAAMYAAVEIAGRYKGNKHCTIVALFPDSGERYLDYLYNEDFEVPLAKKMDTKTGFATKAIHANVKDFQDKGALIPPIHRSAIYRFNRVEDVAAIFKGDNKDIKNRDRYLYIRGMHPNQRLLEKTVATLEGGIDAMAFASGMSAITSLGTHLLKTGDHVLASKVLYAESYNFYRDFVKKWDVETTFVDITQDSEVEKAFRKNTKFLYIETPTNPLLTIGDIEKLAAIAHGHKSLLIVDNTFATPYLQQPLRLGADIVVLSSTKYLSGHSDAAGGLVVAKDQQIILDLWKSLFITGNIIDPTSAWLTLRGIKTLALRMERHCNNAMAIAKHLSRHPKIKEVYYPGLLNHPQHDLARIQMNGFGGIVSFELKGNVDDGRKFVNHLKIFSISVSLGAVESLVNHPASMTHSVMSREDRLKSGIADGLIRFSLGIEDIEDLIADLDQAFKYI